MGIGAEHHPTGHAEALQVDLVRDAVARLGEMDAELLRRGHEEDVVVGVLVVGLEQVVVDVLGRQLHLDPVNPEGHELQHRHGAGCVLEQGVIDPDGDLLAGDQFPFHQMCFENLRCKVLSHFESPFKSATETRHGEEQNKRVSRKAAKAQRRREKSNLGL